MRRLTGRASPLLIAAPARLAGRVDEDPNEDFWDPAGVPGPFDIALAGQPKRLRWWFWTVARR